MILPEAKNAVRIDCQFTWTCSKRCGPLIPNRSTFGFTLIELILVIAIFALLTSLLLPSTSNVSTKAKRLQCVSNLRQVDMSLRLYLSDNEFAYPPRSVTNNWVRLLQSNLGNTNLLVCPTESATVDRTYILNGFNDWFQANLSMFEYLEYEMWRYPRGLNESAILEPSSTAIFGEKIRRSYHLHLDILQANGNDLEELDHKHHRSPGGSGGSNYAFADGSVRQVEAYGTIYPMNLWAITDEWRMYSRPK